MSREQQSDAEGGRRNLVVDGYKEPWQWNEMVKLVVKEEGGDKMM